MAENYSEVVQTIAKQVIQACKSTAKQSVKETTIQPTQITGEISAAKIRNLDLVVQRVARMVVDEMEVDGARIRDASITDAKIVELTASKIAAGTIDASVVTIENLVADNITTGTLNGQIIPQLGTDKVKDGAITGDKVATNAIGADKIVAGAITAEKMAVDSINASNIISGSITTDELSADVGTKLNIRANESVEMTYNRLEAFENTVYGYQKFTEDGLEIGKVVGNDTPFKAKFTADKLSFYENNNEVAYISNQKMFITQAQVTDGLMVGGEDADGAYSFVTTKTGMALRWRK